MVVLLELELYIFKEFCWAAVVQLQPSHRKHCASAGMKVDPYSQVWHEKISIKYSD